MESAPLSLKFRSSHTVRVGDALCLLQHIVNTYHTVKGAHKPKTQSAALDSEHELVTFEFLHSGTYDFDIVERVDAETVTQRSVRVVVEG